MDYVRWHAICAHLIIMRHGSLYPSPTLNPACSFPAPGSRLWIRVSRVLFFPMFAIARHDHFISPRVQLNPAVFRPCICAESQIFSEVLHRLPGPPAPDCHNLDVGNKRSL